MGRRTDIFMGFTLLTAPIRPTLWLEEHGLRWMAYALCVASLVLLPFMILVEAARVVLRRLSRAFD